MKLEKKIAFQSILLGNKLLLFNGEEIGMENYLVSHYLADRGRNYFLKESLSFSCCRMKVCYYLFHENTVALHYSSRKNKIYLHIVIVYKIKIIFIYCFNLQKFKDYFLIFKPCIFNFLFCL